MRLLNTTTLEFGEFFDSEIPEYLILSHRWGKDEVSYQQMESGKVPDGEGLAKIKNFCQLAAQRGTEWCWVDTCCIDKKSSAELSEAINSMHRWYHNAQRCLIYLSDVPKGQNIRNSAWFTRGWTVQELLAPRDATFYDREWSQIGTRNELGRDISVASGIDLASLEKNRWPERSVACKMSWFAHRHTSRVEDMAYSMLGILDINMPLIYGEGWKAFKRLQIEIVNSTKDESIFAWDPWALAVDEYGSTFDSLRRSGFRDRVSYSMPMLAPSPKCFEACGSMRRLDDRSDILDRPPYVATNKSLQISLPSADFSLSADEISMLTNLDIFQAQNLRHCEFSLLRLNCTGEDRVPFSIALVRPALWDTAGVDTHRLGDMVKLKTGPFKTPVTSNVIEKGRGPTVFQPVSLLI